MTSYLPVDVRSLLPRSGVPVACPLPKLGEAAPSLPSISWAAPGRKGTLVAFVRHCGCPFAEKETTDLMRIAKEDKDVQVVVIAHSEREVAETWFASIVGKDQPANVHLLADPNLNLNAAFGIGLLPWSGMFSWAMFQALRNLASQGIVNRQTGEGSYRWANSGGFAVGTDGKVRWLKLAEHAGDTCNYDEANAALAR